MTVTDIITAIDWENTQYVGKAHVGKKLFGNNGKIHGIRNFQHT